MPVSRSAADRRYASPYLRYWLALGRVPAARVHGWVTAQATGGADNLPRRALVALYGDAVRAECAEARFRPVFDRALAKQSAEARQAAERWGERLIEEGRY